MRAELSPVVVLGATGQLGRALVATLGDRAVALSRARADLTRMAGTLELLDDIAPAAVINAAAYTRVDDAETEETLANRINGEAPASLARYCATRKIPFVHFSTDYVFSGAGDQPWLETDTVAPINAYGRGKLLGERGVAAAGGDSLIFRTSWVYDGVGRNFLTTMLRLGCDQATLDVIDDQVGAPTYAPSLADAVARAIVRPSFPPGIYHLCAVGTCSWFEFAETIFASARSRGAALAVESLRRVASADYPTAAPRPLNSRLRTAKAQTAFGIALPHWRDDLEVCLDGMLGKPAR
jgi:dTDP-4-dehydrorhamnose reductase